MLLAGPEERSLHWRRFAGRAGDPCGGPTLEQADPDPVKGTYAGEVDELQLVRQTHIGVVYVGLASVVGNPLWSVGRM